ncbi:hyalin [Apostichopus japonicus]|uniref:Hyalin n=1 Tax=Stichopus japonicus TaxID=307972 RepID=A0A2G8JUB6_STIJA|nr:hyalin [Apostichopus japonicus]
MGKKGVLHGYNAPVCEDDVDGNLPVVCYPPSGILVDREYETIQCNCTDSDGLMDSVTFPVANKSISEKTSSPPLIETRHRESVSSYNMGKKGVLHGYNAPVCEDDVDGNLPVVCYPPSGILVDREYETIQCNCTDSDGLMDSVTFPVTKKTSSPPLIETRHRESVSSYNIGKKGVLHGYNAPVCEDDVDGNLPVVCYPPSGILVDREYETIQCNCTDSDGQMDNVAFPVTSIPHGLHLFWMKENSLLVISILIMVVVVLILIFCHLYKNQKQLNANLAASHQKEIKLNDKQNSYLNERKREEVSHLKDQLEQNERQETEMKKKLEEQNDKINNSNTELTGEEEVSHLKDQLEQNERQTLKN